MQYLNELQPQMYLKIKVFYKSIEHFFTTENVDTATAII